MLLVYLTIKKSSSFEAHALWLGNFSCCLLLLSGKSHSNLLHLDQSSISHLHVSFLCRWHFMYHISQCHSFHTSNPLHLALTTYSNIHIPQFVSCTTFTSVFLLSSLDPMTHYFQLLHTHTFQLHAFSSTCLTHINPSFLFQKTEIFSS